MQFECTLTANPNFRIIRGVNIERELKINEQITAPQVHLIMGDGRSAGNVSVDQARYLAHQYELDLVEIGPNAVPPVAKLLDYNKFRYQQEKHARGVAKVKNELKEMRLSFTINPHDIETKARRAKEFLDQGHFVRVYINLRGRENAFPQKAAKTLEEFVQAVDASVEQPVNQAGKRIQLIIKPKKK